MELHFLDVTPGCSNLMWLLTISQGTKQPKYEIFLCLIWEISNNLLKGWDGKYDFIYWVYENYTATPDPYALIL